MKNRWISYVLSAILVSTAAILLAQSSNSKPRKGATAKPPEVHVDAGEQAFRANCSRCHYAPDQLSPRITGTVLRHMRVRANLSAKDEELILHYLAP